MLDLKCPFCGNENTTKVPNEIFDASVKSTWWMIVIFGILGISIHPMILLLAIAAMIINIIINILVKIKSRNVWIMQCPRCKKEFTVPNPDKMQFTVLSGRHSVLERPLSAAKRPLILTDCR